MLHMIGWDNIENQIHIPNYCGIDFIIRLCPKRR